MRILLISFYAAILLVYTGSAIAIPTFLSAWQEVYPSSSSSQRNCQLCHAQVEGGEPWNAYGFEIRDAYLTLFGSINIAAAIEFVEDNNSDGDSQSLSNLEEINLGLDPGWAPGPVNVWIFKNGDAIGGKLPPFTEAGSEEEICFPIKLKQGAISVVCL